MKTIFLKIPEYYFMALAVLAGYSPPFNFNPVFIGIIVIISLQIIFKNKISGLILGVLFFLINLYFLVALFSELNEFTYFNGSAMQLSIAGLTIWLLNGLVSSAMIYKYIMKSIGESLVELTDNSHYE